jgi:hypothetical protein
MRRGIAMAGFLVLALGVVGPPVIAHDVPSGQSVRRMSPAPAAGWEANVRLAKGRFWDVSVVFDSANHAHVAASGRTDGKTGLWYFTDRTGTWTHQRILADRSGKGWRDPSIAVDSNGRIIIAAWLDACPDCGPHGPSEGIFIVSDRGQAPGEFQTVPTKVVAGPAAMPSLKTFGTRLALAYLSELVSLGPLPKLLFTTQVNGDWKTTTVAAHSAEPSLRTDSQGRARIAYAGRGGVFYASAGTTTGGFTVTELPGTSSADWPVALALDSGGKPTIVWQHGGSPDTIRYAHEGASWPAPTTVAKAPIYTETVGISLESSDVPHILAAGGSVREETRVGSTFVETILARNINHFGAAIRISPTGREVVLWATDIGLFLAERSL